MQDLSQGEFQEVLADPQQNAEAKRLILCSGKVFYDLEAYRNEHQITDTSIVRIEQLYPLHKPKLESLYQSYTSLEQVVWCQEESENNGAWFHLESRLRRLLGREILYAGRDASASSRYRVPRDPSVGTARTCQTGF